MNNYYNQIRVSRNASTNEIEKAIKKRWSEIKKMKIPSNEKSNMKKQLEHIKSVLTDYHKRREYDDFFYHFYFSSPSFANMNEMTIPPQQQHQNLTILPLFETENPIMNSDSQVQSFSMNHTTDQNGSIIYTHNYENTNGKENEYNEKITINKDGRVVRTSQPNRYIDL
jgi:DnaJ-class molecular chaperone